jgi:hypothetical protein
LEDGRDHARELATDVFPAEHPEKETKFRKATARRYRSSGVARANQSHITSSSSFFLAIPYPSPAPSPGKREDEVGVKGGRK